MTYDWHFERLWQYRDAFLVGVQTTITLTVLSLILGSAFGVLLYVLGRGSIASLIVLTTICDIVRAVPPLVVILFFYYFLSKSVIGVAISPYWVAVIALSVNLGSFIFDIVRGAAE